MEDHAALTPAAGARPSRDALGFAGLAPLVALAVLGLLLVVHELAGYARAWLGTSAWVLLPLAIPAAFAALLGTGSLLRCWRWLLAPDHPLPAARRYRLWPNLLISVLVVFVLAQRDAAAGAMGWEDTLLLACAVANFAASALLLAWTARTAPWTRAARVLQAAAIVAAWAGVAWPLVG